MSGGINVTTKPTNAPLPTTFGRTMVSRPRLRRESDWTKSEFKFLGDERIMESLGTEIEDLGRTSGVTQVNKVIMFIR